MADLIDNTTLPRLFSHETMEGRGVCSLLPLAEGIEGAPLGSEACDAMIAEVIARGDTEIEGLLNTINNLIITHFPTYDGGFWWAGQADGRISVHNLNVNMAMMIVSVTGGTYQYKFLGEPPSSYLEHYVAEVGGNTIHGPRNSGVTGPSRIGLTDWWGTEIEYRASYLGTGLDTNTLLGTFPTETEADNFDLSASIARLAPLFSHLL